MNENQEQNIEKIREDFVANASHELKTPITSIQLAAETALNAINDGNTEDGLKFIKQILRNSERMSLLISDLLDLSKTTGLYFLQIFFIFLPMRILFLIFSSYPQ